MPNPGGALDDGGRNGGAKARRRLDQSSAAKELRLKQLLRAAPLGRQAPAPIALEPRLPALQLALTVAPNPQLMAFADLFDEAVRTCGALLVCHYPLSPCQSLLPWILRELGRVGRPPLRTLFINIGSRAVRELDGLGLHATSLAAIGAARFQHQADVRCHELDPVTKVFFLLGRNAGQVPEAVPVRAVTPYAIASRVGRTWAPRSEPILAGLRRMLPSEQVSADRPTLELLGDPAKSTSFAHLVPRHLERTEQRAVIGALRSRPDLAVVDLTRAGATGTHELNRRLGEILDDLMFSHGRLPPLLILTDDPRRHQRCRRSLASWSRDRGALAVAERFLLWTADDGFSACMTPTAHRSPARAGMRLIASDIGEIVQVLWRAAGRLKTDPNLPQPDLASDLLAAARSLVTATMSATPIDELLGTAERSGQGMRRYALSYHAHHDQLRRRVTELDGEGKLLDALDRALDLATATRRSSPLRAELEAKLRATTTPRRLGIILRQPDDVVAAERWLEEWLTSPEFAGRPVPEPRVWPAKATRGPQLQALDGLIVAGDPLETFRRLLLCPEAPADVRVLLAAFDVGPLADHLDAVLALDAEPYRFARPLAEAWRRSLPSVPHALPADLRRDILTASRLPSTATAASDEPADGWIELEDHDRLGLALQGDYLVIDPDTGEPRDKAGGELAADDELVVMPDTVREELAGLFLQDDGSTVTPEQLMVRRFREWARRGREAIECEDRQALDATKLLQRMRQLRQDLPSVTPKAVNYWLGGLDEGESETPFAARKRDHFLAFCAALRIEPVMAEACWPFILRARTSLQHRGQALRNIFERVVLDPDSLARLLDLDPAVTRRIRDEALRSTSRIQAIHLHRVIDEEQAP